MKINSLIAICLLAAAAACASSPPPPYGGEGDGTYPGEVGCPPGQSPDSVGERDCHPR